MDITTFKSSILHHINNLNNGVTVEQWRKIYKEVHTNSLLKEIDEDTYSEFILALMQTSIVGASKKIATINQIRENYSAELHQNHLNSLAKTR